MTVTPHTTREPVLWDLADIIRILRRRWLWLALLPCLLMGLAVAVAIVVPRQYVAKTTLLLDPLGLQVLERELTPKSQNSTISLAVVESQMSVLTSDNVLRQVINQENLVRDKEFGRGRITVLGSIKQAVRKAFGVASKRADPIYETLNNLRRAVRAERIVNSYVIDLRVRSRDPAKSATIANAIAAVYINQERADRAGTNQRASAGLSRQLQSLQARVQASENAVEAFKTKNDILSTRGGLVNEQQLAELTNQLVAAGVQSSQAKAKYDQIAGLLRGGISPDALGATVQSATIGQLRVRLAAARQGEAALLASMRPAHPAVQSARASVDTILRQIRDELNRIAQTAKSELERARSNEQQLVAARNELKRQAERTNSASVQLRELERTAKANRSVYEAFLVRIKEIAGQKGVDVSNARIVTPAVPPQDAAGPGLALLLGGALVAGLGAGAVLALLIEQLTGSTIRNAALEMGAQASPTAGTARADGLQTRDGGLKMRSAQLNPGSAAYRDVSVDRGTNNDAHQSSGVHKSDQTVPTVREHAELPQREQVAAARGGRQETIGATTRHAMVGDAQSVRRSADPDQTHWLNSVGAGDDTAILDISAAGSVRPGSPAAIGQAAILPFNRARAAPPAPRGLEIARAMALQSYSDRLRGRRALQRGHEIDVIGELDAKQLDGVGLAAVVLDRPASEDAAPYMKVMHRCGMLRGERKSFVVLVMAPAAHNGSAHVALNLASAAALQDEAVLLVDADVRSRTLSRTLCPQATSGIRDVLQGGNEIIDTVWHDPQSFDLLPAAPSGPLRSRAEQRGLAFKTMFAEAAEDYSMVVVDGGSLGSVGIGARIAAAADDIVLVVCSDRPGVDIEIALPDQIKLLGHKVRGAIAITGSGQMSAAT